MRTNAGSRPELLNPASVFEIICTINQSFLLASDEDLVSFSPFLVLPKNFLRRPLKSDTPRRFFRLSLFLCNNIRGHTAN